jgi:aryl-alcohol dehydrogenase-like predicted oxidoreductase
VKYTRLGNTGTIISVLGLGTMTFGEKDISKLGTVPMEIANRLVKKAYDAGINLYDTADVYEEGRAEEILGEAVRPFRNQVIIATKVRGKTGSGLNDVGLSRVHIFNSIKASLRRLGTDYVDLYQFHGWDTFTPIEESMEAMEQLVRDGKVIYPGVSNFAAWQMAYLQGIVRAKGYTPYVSAQMNYSLLNRDIEYEVVPFLKHSKMTLLVWSPLHGGVLSGKYTDLEKPPPDTRLARRGRLFPYFEKEQLPPILEKLNEIGKEAGATPAQVAIAWILSKGAVVLIGARTVEQLEENIEAVNVNLKPSQIKELDELTKLRSMYPNWMIERQNAERIPKEFIEPF